MKLYYRTGACSLSPRIALIEGGLNYKSDKVDRATKKTASGENFLEVNPREYVPALRLDDGTVMTEGSAIVAYLADQAPVGKLAPKYGSKERYKVNEWLAYIGSEIHKGGFSPLFRAQNDEQKAAARAALEPKFNLINKQLEGHDYLVGNTFTVADGYLFTCLTWSAHVGIDLTKWPTLNKFFTRVGERPAVKQAIAEEKQ